MNKFETLDGIVTDGNGYLLTSQVLNAGISKPTLAAYVRKRDMKRVGHGIYLAEDAWEDDLFQLYASNARIVFSHETALSLHGLMEREPARIDVTVKAGYNATHLRRRGVRVHQVKADMYEIGMCEVETTFGNKVCAYDRERTICDILLSKDSMDVQVFQYAMKEYMASSEKNLNRLMGYTRKFQLEPVVRTYTEVML